MLNNLAFANPAGAWAFLAVAATVALYLFYRRYRPQRVTGLFLWGAPRRDDSGGRRMEKFLAGRTFWFDVAAATLLALAMTEPIWLSGERALVLVLDASLSMQSRDNHREAVRIASESAASSRRAAVVFAGPTPRMAKTLAAASRAELAAWLNDNYFPAEHSADLAAALSFATDVYGDGVDLHVVTNQSFAAVRATVHQLAGRGDNLAFSHIWRTPGGENGETLFLGIENFGAETRAQLSVYTGEETVAATRDLNLPAGTSRLSAPLPSAAGQMIRVEISGGDDCIASDSIAFVPPQGPGLPSVAVRDMSAATRVAVEAAFRAAGCPIAPDSEKAELLATGDPSAKGRVATLRFVGEKEPGIAAPPYRVDSASVLCRDLDLSETAWTVAARNHTARPDVVFVEVGGIPLYWREGETEFVLNLLPDRANFARGPAWPILLANLTAQTESLRPGLSRRWFFPGETVRVRTARRTGENPALRKDGVPVAEAMASALRFPSAAGLYQFFLHAADGEDAGGEAVAVLPLYGAASDARQLSATARTLRPPPEAGAADGGVPLRWALFLAALFLLGCNYFAAARRGGGRT